jgi:hypothetical protein
MFLNLPRLYSRLTKSRLTKSGDSASVRFLFAFFKVNECYGDFSRVSCLVSRFPMSQAEQYCYNGQDERTDHARFGTHHSSRQPLWPAQSHIEEVVRRGKSAVGHAIKECLAPVIAEVPSRSGPLFAAGVRSLVRFHSSGRYGYVHQHFSWDKLSPMGTAIRAPGPRLFPSGMTIDPLVLAGN